MIMGHVETLIENGKKITLKSILLDIQSGNDECLYFATEEQISKLIDQGKIDEDYFSRHQDYLEEMRVMINEG